ncbi:hypothetical protein BJY00DRAFT_310634 [Aspergillus carlsbadensis]|nr:hypothetical protein BJY00DRAFT_310634 [Aspergillus carlsbadensis]
MARSAEAPAGSDVDIESTLLTSLSETPYGCSSLVPLKAGVANTSYRGRLQCPLANGSETIVVKHYRTLADVENAILLPQSRARIESGFLDTMKDTCFTVSNVSLRTPRHFHFDPETETEVMEDITQCDTLRDYLLSDAGRNISSATAASIGECIGGWLADFHARDWSHLDEVFSAALHRNSAILSSLHHHILEHVLATFDDPAVREGAHEAIKVLDEARPVVNHGDFTTRKYVQHLIQLPLCTVVAPQPLITKYQHFDQATFAIGSVPRKSEPDCPGCCRLGGMRAQLSDT